MDDNYCYKYRSSYFFINFVVSLKGHFNHYFYLKNQIMKKYFVFMRTRTSITFRKYSSSNRSDIRECSMFGNDN